MNLAQFQHLVDACGADLSRWPADVRLEAERTMATDPAAASAFAQGLRLDALIVRGMAPRAAAGAEEAAASHIMAALNRPLPAQRRRALWRWWPAELTNFDLAPAWPRIAALAGVAVLGFALGLVGVDTRLAAGSALTRAAPADVDVSAIALEPESVTGLRP